MAKIFSKIIIAAVFAGIFLLSCSSPSGSPTQPEATRFDNNTVTIAFDEEAASLTVNWGVHAGVKEYTVYYSYWDGSEKISGYFGPIAGCSAEIGNIFENARYDVQIKATTVSGTTFWSFYSSVDTGPTYTITYDSIIQGKGNVLISSSRHNRDGGHFPGSTITIFVVPEIKVGGYIDPDDYAQNPENFTQYVLNYIESDDSSIEIEPYSATLPIPSFTMPGNDITLTVHFKELPKDNYFIYADRYPWDPSIYYYHFFPPYAPEGENITVYVKAAENYELTEFIIDGNDIMDLLDQDPLDVVEYPFTMPANHVRFDASGKKLKKQ